MNYLKKIINSFKYTLIIFLLLLIIITTLSYFYIISLNTTNILLLINTVISVLVGSFILGKNSKQKGYLEGIKYGLILISLFFTLNLIFYKNINISITISYLIILLSSTLGSMFGITKKKN